MNAIYQLVRYNIGLFQENDESEAYELFQKALRIKRIRNYSLLSSSQLEELFISLEKHCAHISYFWVQYGLAVQLNKRFEDANNHFLYAQNIRPNSYQVAHALAKNRMEIGLDSLRKGKVSADENFQLGCDSMLSIINNPRYSRAFSYSVHSYAAMLMKYYTAKNQTIPDGKCEEFSLKILQFPALTLCNSANGDKALIFRRFRHLPCGRILPHISAYPGMTLR